ncbi:MAG: hypothetical protein IPJ16_11815 [Bacteroidales bacterium]|nr:hypothetical protein [Bacteroidales bacterium]
MFRDLLKTDLKLIIHRPVIISAILIPVLLVTVLKFVFPFISVLINSGNRLKPEDYFTIISLVLISSIPLVVGFILASGFSHRSLLSSPTQHYRKEISAIFFIRILETFFLSFVLVLLAIIITDPIPFEGWLRSLYISVLLSLQSVHLVFLITNRIYHKASNTVNYLISALVLIAVPVGLLLNSPFNCLAFFSPLYWISWAWLTDVRVESVISGAISILIISGPVIIIYRILFRRKPV